MKVKPGTAFGSHIEQADCNCVSPQSQSTYGSRVCPRLLGSAPIRTSSDDLILAQRLPEGDRMLDLMPEIISVTSWQSSLAPVTYARLFSTVGRKCSPAGPAGEGCPGKGDRPTFGNPGTAPIEIGAC